MSNPDAIYIGLMHISIAKNQSLYVPLEKGSRATRSSRATGWEPLIYVNVILRRVKEIIMLKVRK